MVLSREQFLKPVDRRYKDVPTPRGDVRIRSMTERERMLIDDALSDEEGKPRRSKQMQYRQSIIVTCLVGEDNEPLLSLADVGTPPLDNLDDRDASIIFAECIEHCRIPKDVDTAVAVKNSKPTPDDTQPAD